MEKCNLVSSCWSEIKTSEEHGLHVSVPPGMRHKLMKGYRDSFLAIPMPIEGIHEDSVKKASGEFCIDKKHPALQVFCIINGDDLSLFASTPINGRTNNGFRGFFIKEIIRDQDNCICLFDEAENVHGSHLFKPPGVGEPSLDCVLVDNPAEPHILVFYIEP